MLFVSERKHESMRQRTREQRERVGTRGPASLRLHGCSLPVLRAQRSSRLCSLPSVSLYLKVESVSCLRFPFSGPLRRTQWVRCSSRVLGLNHNTIGFCLCVSPTIGSCFCVSLPSPAFLSPSLPRCADVRPQYLAGALDGVPCRNGLVRAHAQGLVPECFSSRCTP